MKHVKHWFFLCFLFCTLCTGSFLVASFTLANSRANSSLAEITVHIGPVEVVRGPGFATDNPFYTLSEVSSLQAYITGYNPQLSPTNSTWRYTGGSLETLRFSDAPILQGGSGNNFDSCGAWLNSVWQYGTVIRGWYHAETECDYDIGQSQKSIAYAESHDGGQTFTKPNYPGNQVIKSPLAYTDPNQDDEGDHHVIRVGDFLYLYFLSNHQPSWQIYLARSPTSNGGLPGTWQKYYNGEFTQPGINGEASPIAPWTALASSWVSFNSYLNSYIGFSGFWQKGLGFSLSPDGVNDWASLPYLILSSEGSWDRSADSRDLVAYPSIVSVYGDSERAGDTFWIYYMYLNPGDDFDKAYLVRRKTHIRYGSSDLPIDLVPRIALSRYQKSEDTWLTTTNTDPDYQFEKTIGSLFTDEVPNSEPVYDCYIDFWTDHMLTVGDPSCGNGSYLRKIGWISTVPFDNSVQVYRCWDMALANHFASTDPNCEGKTTEESMGYLATLSPFPQNEFIALSDYYDSNQEDSWVTVSDPPTEYVFQSRIGYMFTTPHPDSIPIYDCYIDFWDDHMLVPQDSTCDGAQNLGQIGWIATKPFPGSIPIFRCFDEQTTNHFISLDMACNGKFHYPT